MVATPRTTSFLAASARPGRASRRTEKRATSPRQKPRLGFFSGPSGRSCRRTAQVAETASGCRAYGYKTASGLPGWLNHDPIGERGGPNLYAYCNNDGVNRFDPLGLAEGRFNVSIDERRRVDSDVEINYIQSLKSLQCCPEVKLVQIIRGDKPNGYSSDWTIDGDPKIEGNIHRDPGQPFPYYPFSGSGNGDGKLYQLPAGVARLADRPGFVSNSDIKNQFDAIFWDIQQDFETCAICVKTGKILGCHKWGHYLPASYKNVPRSDYGDTNDAGVPAIAPSEAFIGLVAPLGMRP